MAESVTLVAQPRSGRGSQLARQLRRKGLVPAVLYGHKEETLSLAFPLEDLERTIKRGIRVLDIDAAGQVQKVLIREVQFDHLGKEMLHVDFARVSADERIVVPIRVELKGIAPGVTAGGALDQPIHRLSVECLAIAVPESVRVNIGELQIGMAVHVRDLVLPEGVKAMVDPDAIVVHVTAPLVEPTAAPAAPVAEQAEPEVIGRQKAEEEEEAE